MALGRSKPRLHAAKAEAGQGLRGEQSASCLPGAGTVRAGEVATSARGRAPEPRAADRVPGGAGRGPVRWRGTRRTPRSGLRWASPSARSKGAAAGHGPDRGTTGGVPAGQRRTARTSRPQRGAPPQRAPQNRQAKSPATPGRPAGARAARAARGAGGDRRRQGRRRRSVGPSGCRAPVAVTTMVFVCLPWALLRGQRVGVLLDVTLPAERGRRTPRCRPTGSRPGRRRVPSIDRATASTLLTRHSISTPPPGIGLTLVPAGQRGWSVTRK